jgi:thymidylate synthase
MKTFTSSTLAQILPQLLYNLLHEPDYVVGPRDQLTHEITNCILHIENPEYNLFQNQYRSSKLKYISAEILWYLSGQRAINFIGKYSSMWSKLIDGYGNVNSAYGNLIFKQQNKSKISQYYWVIHSLMRDKDSRQAIMHFNLPDHQTFRNKDFVCTLNAIFQIRQNRLHMTVDMRSNDVIYGLLNDFAFFSLLQQHVLLSLRTVYPDLQLGSYTHVAHSMHLYQKHFETVNQMLKSVFQDDMMPELQQPILDYNGCILPAYRPIFDDLNSITVDTTTDHEFLRYLLHNLNL